VQEEYARAVQAASQFTMQGSASALLPFPTYDPIPDHLLLLQAVIVPGEKTTEGQIIEAVTLPWFAIIDLVQRDPRALYEIDWRKLEELVAGAYRQQGYDVVLTPRSADGGIDIIASSRGFGSICYFDQVKRFAPDRPVTADDVRAMVGVPAARGNVSKGIITTTSSFAPVIETDPDLQRFMPYRLELRPKDALLEWLQVAAAGRPN
jgi:restriction system protein